MNSKKIKIGAFQFSPCNDIGKNLEAIKRGITLAAEKNVRLLLTQECALCGYPPVEIPSVDSINQVAQYEALKEISLLSKQNNMFIALGMVSFIDNCIYNSIQLISPENTYYKPYNKRALWGWDKDNFTEGNDIGVYSIDGIKIGIRICFEVRFPEYFRELFRNKVDLCLISFTDIGKLEQKKKLNIIQSHLVSRAAENVMYVLSANSISQYQLAPTCLINPDGIILETAPLNEESLITRQIEILPPNFGQEGRIINSEILQGGKQMGSYIRYASKEDLDTLVLINSKSFQQAFKGIIPDDFLNGKFSYESLKERLCKELDEGNTTNCIMYKDDIPVGMLTFMKDSYKERDESEIDLGRIYLLPEYWGQNIGIEFIEWGVKELKNKGYVKVALWVVEENLRARKFYEKVGFAHGGEIRIINPGREIKEYRYVKDL